LLQRCCDGPIFQQRSHTACLIQKPSLETPQSCKIDSVRTGLAIWGTPSRFGACFSPRLATGSTAGFRFYVGIGLFLSVHSCVQKGRGVHRSRTLGTCELFTGAKAARAWSWSLSAYNACSTRNLDF
jgi:hypothetical protein